MAAAKAVAAAAEAKAAREAAEEELSIERGMLDDEMAQLDAITDESEKEAAAEALSRRSQVVSAKGAWAGDS